MFAMTAASAQTRHRYHSWTLVEKRQQETAMALPIPMRFLACALGFVAAEMRSDDFPHYGLGTIPAWQDLASLRGARPDAQAGSTGKVSDSCVVCVCVWLLKWHEACQNAYWLKAYDREREGVISTGAGGLTSPEEEEEEEEEEAEEEEEST